jgi:hypothetical protein
MRVGSGMLSNLAHRTQAMPRRWRDHLLAQMHAGETVSEQNRGFEPDAAW